MRRRCHIDFFWIVLWIKFVIKRRREQKQVLIKSVWPLCMERTRTSFDQMCLVVMYGIKERTWSCFDQNVFALVWWELYGEKDRKWSCFDQRCCSFCMQRMRERSCFIKNMNENTNFLNKITQAYKRRTWRRIQTRLDNTNY